jgi:hypothetical protein
VAEGVYSNGLPHPSSALRLRFAAELGVLSVLTVLFFLLAPKSWHNSATYAGLALVMFGYIGFTRTVTNERIWGPPESPDFDRVRRCAVSMTLLTLPPVVIFLILGAVGRYLGVFEAIAHHFGMANYTPAPMFGHSFFIALVLYLPWALLQQTLFQFYLLSRLRGLLPFASPLFLSVLNGVAYGLVHLRTDLASLGVTVVTIIGGIFWSYSYYRDRFVLPIAISHAVLGSTFYYWIYGRDLLAEFLVNFKPT